MVDRADGKPWGLWPTIGFSAVIAVVFIAVQLIVYVIFAGVHFSCHPGRDQDQYFGELNHNGTLIAVMTLSTSLVCSLLIWLFTALRKNLTAARYLCLKKISWSTVFRWLGITFSFAVFTDVFRLMLGKPLVPEVMVETYRSASGTGLFLLWLALWLAAPFEEELFFRGFLFEGLRASKAGPAATVVLTAFFWAVIHVQYDFVDTAVIFANGLLLGMARLQTGSLYTAWGMHALVNIYSTVQTEMVLRAGVP